MESEKFAKRPLLRAERSFVGVIDGLTPEVGEETLPLNFVEKTGHTCGADHEFVKKVNNNDLRRTATNVSKETGKPVSEVIKEIREYYC